MHNMRILFVDDQPNVLNGLRRMLNKMSNKWDMVFVESGAEALAILEKYSFDVIVSDMRMPEMTGAELLDKVSRLYPGTIRFILSGHTERELILQAAGVAHQYIAKPCESETLKLLLARSIGLRKLLSNPELHTRIASVKSLPSLPSIYNQVVAELKSENASLKEIARLISQDVGISAKVLQMINSAFFGLPTHVEDMLQAVNLLGLDVIHGLVLTAGVFNQFGDSGICLSAIERIYSHSLIVGTNARDIAHMLDLQKRHIDDAFVAGMLHDVGKLVMLTHFKDEMSAVERIVEKQSLPLHEAEKKVMGVSHAEIGGHLLSLWGLPDSILEAVALHHYPRNLPSPMKNVLTAVHIADAMELTQDRNNMYELTAVIDMEYLDNLGLAEMVSRMYDQNVAAVN